jgi:hypothetical protein
VVGSFYRHLWDVERTNPGRKRVPGHYVRLVSSFVPQTALHHFGFSHLALHTWHKARNGCRRRTCWPFAFKRVRKRGQSRCRKLISTRVSTRNAYLYASHAIFFVCRGVFSEKYVECPKMGVLWDERPCMHSSSPISQHARLPAVLRGHTNPRVLSKVPTCDLASVFPVNPYKAAPPCGAPFAPAWVGIPKP